MKTMTTRARLKAAGWTLFAGLFLAALLGDAEARTECIQINTMITCSDGYSAQRFGNIIYDNRGNWVHRWGGLTLDNHGNSFQRFGEPKYRSKQHRSDPLYDPNWPF